jgi:hypothetical protein
VSEGASSSASSGIGFTGLLAILFIGLKLGGVINWSWWWVLAPVWLPWSLVLLFIGIVATLALASSRR